MSALRFNLADVEKAADTWGFNCGPAALCAVLGMTPDEIRPHLGDFEKRPWMNPTAVFDVLKRLNIAHEMVYRSDSPEWRKAPFPDLAIVRTQFGGPWCTEGVPPRVAYRYTHLSAWWRAPDGWKAFDVNAMEMGGWISHNVWEFKLMPWLIEDIKRASGEWWPTHIIEVKR